MAYLGKMERIIGEAEHILSEERHLLALPGGPLTLDAIDAGIEAKRAQASSS